MGIASTWRRLDPTAPCAIIWTPLFTDFGETAESVLRNELMSKKYDCVMVGAGVRTVATHFLLFEKIVNVIHEHAPGARVCFNTMPSDTAEAVKRWI